MREKDKQLRRRRKRREEAVKKSQKEKTAAGAAEKAAGGKGGKPAAGTKAGRQQSSQRSPKKAAAGAVAKEPKATEEAAADEVPAATGEGIHAGDETKSSKKAESKEKAEPKPTGLECPKCGNELLEREGRFGAFIACGNYPECKYTQPKTLPGLKCPKCVEGDLADKALVARVMQQYDVEAVIHYAEELGWRVELSNGHAWGQLLCPNNDEECRCGEFCRMSIWSTPKNSGNYANQIRKKVEGCIYNRGEND